MFSFQCGTHLLKQHVGELGSGRKEKVKKKENSKPSCSPQDPIWQLWGKHILSPCYHDTTWPEAGAVFQGWKTPMEGYATVRGPLIKIPWPKSFMLFQITDTEEKGERDRSLMSQEHETWSAAGFCMSGNTVRQVDLLRLQKMVSTRKLKVDTFSVTKSQVFLSITESATGKKTMHSFSCPEDTKQFLWLSGQLQAAINFTFPFLICELHPERAYPEIQQFTLLICNAGTRMPEELQLILHAQVLRQRQLCV